MQDASFVITIVEHDNLERVLALQKKLGTSITFSLSAEGTAKPGVLSTLGLSATEKAVMLSIMPGDVRNAYLHDMTYKMFIDTPGAGIVICVPLGAFAGKVGMEVLTGCETLPLREDKNMLDSQYKLVTVICNSGCSEMVMDAARSAGATGGTVLHVKGAGAAQAEKFFGISIGAEKEMILIAASKKNASDIMRAIMAQAGLTTKAHAISFSMPIDQIAGFRLLEENEQ